MRKYIFVCNFIVVVTLVTLLISGCTSPTVKPAADPIAGTWEYKISYNGSTITATLVFNEQEDFRGYLSGMQSLEGRWTRINDTAYNVHYENKTVLYIMSNDRARIWEGGSPRDVFVRQL
ncbi:MAG: hypothetical protein A4E28_01670 [Methanocella sp. PtaU1.Bin125]|nr:MAG: hypothetical protein A4E28_01670 [Methanocella sp. PtaU1.Bin125]